MTKNKYADICWQERVFPSTKATQKITKENYAEICWQKSHLLLFADKKSNLLTFAEPCQLKHCNTSSKVLTSCLPVIGWHAHCCGIEFWSWNVLGPDLRGKSGKTIAIAMIEAKVWLNFSIKKQPGVKLNMPAWVSAISMTPAETFADQKQAYRICWQRRSADGKIFWRNLLTKTKSADKEHLLDNLHKKSRTSGDGKNPETFSSRTNDKCNKNVSSEPITEVLHVYV